MKTSILRARVLALVFLVMALWLMVTGHGLAGVLFLISFSASVPVLVGGRCLGVNNPTIKGDNTILWGTGSGTTIAGIIVSVKNQLTGEMVEIADSNGFTTSVIFFNDKNECEVDMIIQTSAPALARGDFVTIMGIANCIVIDTNQQWEQKGVRKFTVKATAWKGIPAT